MSMQRNEFVNCLRLLENAGCLEHVILVGSWAEYVFQETGLLERFEANIKTMDVDFLLKNQRLPRTPKNLPEAARAAGFLVDNDVISGITRIYNKEGLEIEFLLGKVGAGMEAALKTNLGVTAQTLRHMEVLKRHVCTVVFEGMTLSVPEPEAYALHKAIINHERGRKQEKDLAAIRQLWPFLDQEVLQTTIASLTKKEQKTVFEFVEHNLDQEAHSEVERRP